MSGYSRDKPVYGASALPVGIDAENPHILRWWTPAHDGAIRETILDHRWLWYWYAKNAIVRITSESTLSEWRETDPLCKRYVWYNALMYFACARAEKYGFDANIKAPTIKICAQCNLEFREDSLSVPLVERLNIEQIDFCAPCAAAAFFVDGSSSSTEHEILDYLRELTTALSRIPPSDFGRGIGDLRGVPTEERVIILKLLASRPSPTRVKEVFGSWLNALVKAGVLEDDVRRTARGVHCLARDGHVCYSFGEKTIDDLLHSLNLPHIKEPRYPEGNFRADFEVHGVFIEYFGLAGDPAYDDRIKLKTQICSQHGITLMALFPRDLTSTKLLKAKILQNLPKAPDDAVQ